MPVINRKPVTNHFSLPPRIQRLGELAFNLWWVWNPEAQNLFGQIDKFLWEKTNHNPVAFLHQVQRAQLNAVTSGRNYLESYDRVLAAFDEYMKAEKTWFQENHLNLKNKTAAYFSFEFGLHESLPVYAGGLGVLAGDHLKEASDLGIPLMAVGFIYNQGYFIQKISEDGWQETRNQILAFQQMPILELTDEKGKPLAISLELTGRVVTARIWQVQVGRIPLYLLDTNLQENSPADRDLTARLYTNDPETRIVQEILLGIGGVRALRALGEDPCIWHMNEGHSAFLVLERLREQMSKGAAFDQAKDIVRKGNIFTTHTPVPAGNDVFQSWLIEKYFSQYWADLKISRDQFIGLGSQKESWGESFSMPVLALKLSNHANAVSELHGRVARQMWHFLWPDVAEDDVPISHITNGVHVGSWLARRQRVLYDRYLGPQWWSRMDDPEAWAAIENIPSGELWAVRRHLRRKLLTFIEDRARKQWLSGTISPVQVVAGGVLLDPYALTIGFARRFATYKRGNLVLSDFDRLLHIINNVNMPVQIIFAGKAHPADEPGKMVIQQVYRAVKDSRSGGRLVFLEDYDMNMARYLVQGVDVWMNTPRRPNEASGTSGMKAAMNGVLNFSILDGWWREGYNGKNGWAIGQDGDKPDLGEQDAADAESLFSVLENEIVPCFYGSRSPDNLPMEWVARIKESIRTLAPQFSTRRMVKEYMDWSYLPILSDTETC
jgi:starch phosphorylase